MCVYIWYNVLYNIRNAWWVQCFLCFLKSFSKSCRRSARSSRPLFTRAWHSIGTWRRNRELSLKDSQHLMIDVHSMRGNRWKAYHKCKKRYRGRTIVLKFFLLLLPKKIHAEGMEPVSFFCILPLQLKAGRYSFAISGHKSAIVATRKGWKCDIFFGISKD